MRLDFDCKDKLFFDSLVLCVGREYMLGYFYKDLTA